MSVFIRGMEMPEKCGKCRFATAFECEVTKNFITTFNVRQVDCPLVEVPPHGDLIDRDALRQSMYHEAFETDSPMQKWDSGCWIRYKMFENNIKDTPTIIPASEEAKE